MDELTVVSQSGAWRHEDTAPMLTELSVALAALRSEHQAALEVVHAPGGAAAPTAAAGGGGAAAEPTRRPHFLAQLVPAMLHYNAQRFGKLLQEARRTAGVGLATSSAM